MSSRGALVRLHSRSIAVVFAAIALAAAVVQARLDHGGFKSTPPDECRDCHRTSGIAENHGPNFRKEHRLLAQKPTMNCYECHQQSQCTDCHQGGGVDDIQKGLSRRGESMPRTHAADFISTHAIVARDDPRSCARCHQSQSFCADCHARQIAQNRQGMAIRPHSPTYIGPGVVDPAWVTFHRAEARRNLQTCQGCHPQKADCSNFACHPGLQGR